MGIGITQHTANQFEPKQNKSGNFYLNASQTTDLAVNGSIHFDRSDTNTGVPLNQGTYQWTLKANNKYELEAEVYGTMSAASSYIGCQFYDVTNGAYLATPSSEDLAMTYTSNDTGCSIVKAMVTPSTDILVELRIKEVSNITNVHASYSWAAIKQIGTLETPNTYPFLVNAQQYNLTVTGSNWTTTRAVGVPYKTTDGSWRLKFNIVGAVSAATRTEYTVTIAGVTFKNVASFYQDVSAGPMDAGPTRERSFVTPNTGNITTDHSSFSTTTYNYSGDVELNVQPDFI